MSKYFLPQIKLYQNLLEMKHAELNGKVMRLENGLEKLRTTAVQVDDLKEKLAVQVCCCCCCCFLLGLWFLLVQAHDNDADILVRKGRVIRPNTRS